MAAGRYRVLIRGGFYRDGPGDAAAFASRAEAEAAAAGYAAALTEQGRLSGRGVNPREFVEVAEVVTRYAPAGPRHAPDRLENTGGAG